MMGFKKWCDKCKEEKGLHNNCPASPTKSEEYLEREVIKEFLKPKKIEKLEGLIEQETLYGEWTFANDWNIQQLWEKLNELVDRINALSPERKQTEVGK